MGEKKKVLDDKSTNYYEARWYLDETNKDKYEYREFASKKAMHNFYEKHKKNKGKFNWELTYRNKYGEFLKDTLLMIPIMIQLKIMIQMMKRECIFIISLEEEIQVIFMKWKMSLK